jgi:hypothetical protein
MFPPASTSSPSRLSVSSIDCPRRPPPNRRRRPRSASRRDQVDRSKRIQMRIIPVLATVKSASAAGVVGVLGRPGATRGGRLLGPAVVQLAAR